MTETHDDADTRLHRGDGDDLQWTSCDFSRADHTRLPPGAALNTHDDADTHATSPENNCDASRTHAWVHQRRTMHRGCPLPRERRQERNLQSRQSSTGSSSRPRRGRHTRTNMKGSPLIFRLGQERTQSRGGDNYVLDVGLVDDLGEVVTAVEILKTHAVDDVKAYALTKAARGRCPPFGLRRETHGGEMRFEGHRGGDRRVPPPRWHPNARRRSSCAARKPPMKCCKNLLPISKAGPHVGSNALRASNGVWRPPRNTPVSHILFVYSPGHAWTDERSNSVCI